MSSYVPVALRRAVIQRAGGLCEYCLLHESDGYVGFEVEHIIAEKHGGATSAENLAYACVACNRFKGTDIASIAPGTGTLTRLFNPRLDHWANHFAVNGAWIEPLTDIGDVTVRILSLNDPDRMAERELLLAAGRYPPPEAEHHLTRLPT
jgi:hypothetical protein